MGRGRISALGVKKFLLLLVLLGAVALGGFMVVRQRTGLVLDSKEVLARADRMLPGAWPPQGLEAVMALSPSEDLEVVIFAPSVTRIGAESWEPGDLRIILARPAIGKKMEAAEIKARIQEAQQKKAEEMDELEKSPVVLAVGGKPHPGLEVISKLRSNQVMLRENITVLQGDSPVIVIFSGPNDGYPEQLRDGFLNTLEPPRVAPLPPVAGEGRTPGPPRPGQQPGKNDRLLNEAQQAAGDAIPVPAGVNPNRIPRPDARKLQVDRRKLPAGFGF